MIPTLAPSRLRAAPSLLVLSAALLGCSAQGSYSAGPAQPVAAEALAPSGAPEAAPALSEDQRAAEAWIFKRKRKQQQKKAPPAGSATAGQACGGKLGTKCGAGLFCDMTEADGLSCGTSDRAGTCQPKPEICTRDYRPVCGCDGKTYGNDCERRAAGVARAKEGACGQAEPPKPLPGSGAGAKQGETCGGVAALQCGAGLFCEMTEADGLSCGTPDRAGTCQPTPGACTFDYRPVCGCDGKTYSNDCARRVAGVARAREGACEESGAAPSPVKPSGPSRLPVEGVFLAFTPKACKTNPWETAKVTASEMTYPVKELQLIDGFFQSKKIALLELGLVQHTAPVATCRACTCPRGDLLVVVAKKEDVERLKKEFGFTELSEAGWAQAAPLACGMNPWQKLSGEEPAQVAEYLKKEGAPAEQVGFLYSAGGRATCAACTCPRGDRLLVKLGASAKAPAGFSSLR